MKTNNLIKILQKCKYENHKPETLKPKPKTPIPNPFERKLYTNPTPYTLNPSKSCKNKYMKQTTTKCQTPKP